MNTYKGHEITFDHTGNYVAIDGVDYTGEWHKTNVEHPLDFAKAWIDSPPESPVSRETKDEEISQAFDNIVNAAWEGAKHTKKLTSARIRAIIAEIKDEVDNLEHLIQ